MNADSGGGCHKLLRSACPGVCHNPHVHCGRAGRADKEGGKYRSRCATGRLGSPPSLPFWAASMTGRLAWTPHFSGRQQQGQGHPEQPPPGPPGAPGAPPPWTRSSPPRAPVLAWQGSKRGSRRRANPPYGIPPPPWPGSRVTRRRRRSPREHPPRRSCPRTFRRQRAPQRTPCPARIDTDSETASIPQMGR